MLLNFVVKILMEILDKFADKDETFDLLPYLRRYSLDITTGKFCHLVIK